jgi:hypothetical protein
MLRVPLVAVAVAPLPSNRCTLRAPYTRTPLQEQPTLATHTLLGAGKPLQQACKQTAISSRLQDMAAASARLDLPGIYRHLCRPPSCRLQAAGAALPVPVAPTASSCCNLPSAVPRDSRPASKPHHADCRLLGLPSQFLWNPK